MLIKLRRLEKEYYLKKRTLSDSNVAGTEELRIMDAQVCNVIYYFLEQSTVWKSNEVPITESLISMSDYYGSDE